MWFKRMTLEVWFDDYQYEVEYDIGESAVKYLTLDQLDIDLIKVPLRYGYHTGRPLLKALIAEQYPGFSGENIVVTTGASEANFCVVAALVAPGDHVIIEHPTYPSLYEVPRSLGADVSLFTLEFDNGFKPDLDKLQDMITPNTKLITFTHPNNPTGSMITEDELRDLVSLVDEHGIHLLFDETYRAMDFKNSLPPAATLSPNVTSIASMSKCYGLPGIRVGWVATQNKPIIDAVLTIREQVSICNNAVGEVIALHVLERRDAFLHSAQTHIATNRSTVSQWVDHNESLDWVYPEVGVVSFPRLKPDILQDPEKSIVALRSSIRPL
jgi:aspartate/methionine/tyrosine aminotransferase